MTIQNTRWLLMGSSWGVS